MLLNWGAIKPQTGLVDFMNRQKTKAMQEVSQAAQAAQANQFQPPNNFNYGATYNSTPQNSYANRIMAGVPTVANQQANVQNPYANQIATGVRTLANQQANVVNRNLGNNALTGMNDQWNTLGSPTLNSYMGQINQGLDSSAIQKSYMDRAADNAAKATAASVNAAREAGMSPSEALQMRGQGMADQQSAMRDAQLTGDQVAMQRRGEAANALNFLRSPAEQLGQAQIASGENVAGRQFSAAQQYANTGNANNQNTLDRLANMGENLAGRQYGAGQQYANTSNANQQAGLDRMYNMGENQAQRDFTGGENYATRALGGLRTGMEFGPAPALGYGASMLMGGAGMDTQNPQFTGAMTNWQNSNNNVDNSLAGLYGKMGGYYDWLMNGAQNPANANTGSAGGTSTMQRSPGLPNITISNPNVGDGASYDVPTGRRQGR